MIGLARLAWWGGLFLILLWAPVPLGSVNTQWSMPLAAACLALGATGILLDPGAGRRGLGIPRVLLPFGLLVAWFGCQLVPLPEAVVGLISPERLTFPAVPGGGGDLRLSVYPGVTLERALLHLGLFYLLWALVRSPSRASFRILAAVGFVHAVLALVLSQSGGTNSLRVLWVYELPEVLTPFGTFVNKNHFAGFMAVTGGACFAVLLRRISRAVRRSGDLAWHARLSVITGRGFFRIGVPMVGFLTITLTLFASGSRGAAAAFGVAILAVPAAAMAISGRFRLWVPAVLGGVVVLVAVLGSVGSSVSVTERLIPGGRYLNRPRVWKNTLLMAAEYPVTGTGLGTFPYVFPRYQRVAPDREFTHAEGDWVQYAAETGLVGVIALLLFGVLLARRVFASLRRPGSRWALVTGGAVGLSAIVLHGMLDSSLHIPANMLAASVLLGGTLGVAGPRLRPAPARQPRGNR